jgi:hypothetical protein
LGANLSTLMDLFAVGGWVGRAMVAGVTLEDEGSGSANASKLGVGGDHEARSYAGEGLGAAVPGLPSECGKELTRLLRLIYFVTQSIYRIGVQHVCSSCFV